MQKNRAQRNPNIPQLQSVTGRQQSRLARCRHTSTRPQESEPQRHRPIAAARNRRAWPCCCCAVKACSVCPQATRARDAKHRLVVAVLELLGTRVSQRNRAQSVSGTDVPVGSLCFDGLSCYRTLQCLHRAGARRFFHGAIWPSQAGGQESPDRSPHPGAGHVSVFFAVSTMRKKYVRVSMQATKY